MNRSCGTRSTLLILTMISLLLQDLTRAAVIEIRRADGTTVSDRGPVGGLCMVTVVVREEESITPLSVSADGEQLTHAPWHSPWSFELPCDRFSGSVEIRAQWSDDSGGTNRISRELDIRNIQLKIRVETPPQTPPDRTMYLAGNLHQLGMSLSGEWQPRWFPLSHLGHNHWYGALMVGPGEDIALEFTMGGWGTKGRDSRGEAVKIRRVIGSHEEIAARVHNWGLRTGVIGDRGPYLSVANSEGSAVAITFRRSEPARFVFVGKSPGALSSRKVRHEYEMDYLLLENLHAGDRFFYRLTEEDTLSTFRVPETKTLRFCVLGDTKGSGEIIGSMVRTSQPQLVIDTGDLVSSGWSEEEWNRSLTSISGVARNVPYMVAPGNHEEESPILREVFHYPHAEFFYAFTYGPARFLILDSELPYERGSVQWTFADSVLEAWTGNPTSMIFAAIHNPPYSGGKHGSDLLIRSELCPLLEQGGVAVVFSGHDHGYEASWPVRNGIRAEDGTVYVVTAGGGAELYDTRVGPRGWSRIRLKKKHWIEVSVQNRTATFTAVDEEGALIDRFVIEK